MILTVIGGKYMRMSTSFLAKIRKFYESYDASHTVVITFQYLRGKMLN